MRINRADLSQQLVLHRLSSLLLDSSLPLSMPISQCSRISAYRGNVLISQIPFNDNLHFPNSRWTKWRWSPATVPTFWVVIWFDVIASAYCSFHFSASQSSTLRCLNLNTKDSKIFVPSSWVTNAVEQCLLIPLLSQFCKGQHMTYQKWHYLDQTAKND